MAISRGRPTTAIPGIHSLTASRSYNEGAVLEQRIEELKQLSAGRTAVDDLGGNHLLWALSGLTYQVSHTLRRQLPGPWRRAEPKRLRTCLFDTPARLTWRSRSWRVHLTEAEFDQGLLPRALEALAGSGLRGPPIRPRNTRFSDHIDALIENRVGIVSTRLNVQDPG